MQEACLGALRRAVPSASAETCLMALQATDWDADAAFHQLKSFMTTQPSGAEEVEEEEVEVEDLEGEGNDSKKRARRRGSQRS